jgi:hypothetical protein
LGKWVWRALRDWRVWALVLTIQGPGVRAIVFIVSIAAYGTCLHGPLTPWIRGAGSHINGIVVVLSLAGAVNLVAYRWRWRCSCGP